MIHLHNVTKIYKQNNVVALEDINIDIEKGEFVFIVGTSGSGKSTLMKLLMREEITTSGQIIVDGKNVNSLKPKEIPYLRRILGVIFQDFRLLEDRTVYENVAFAMQVIEAPRHIMQKSVNTVLDIVGLRDKMKHFPGQLSGGEQQRVAIARAIVNDPKIVIADEPTGNLDPETSWDITRRARRLSWRRTTKQSLTICIGELSNLSTGILFAMKVAELTKNLARSGVKNFETTNNSILLSRSHNVDDTKSLDEFCVSRDGRGFAVCTRRIFNFGDEHDENGIFAGKSSSNFGVPSRGIDGRRARRSRKNDKRHAERLKSRVRHERRRTENFAGQTWRTEKNFGCARRLKPVARFVHSHGKKCK